MRWKTVPQTTGRNRIIHRRPDGRQPSASNDLETNVHVCPQMRQCCEFSENPSNSFQHIVLTMFWHIGYACKHEQAKHTRVDSVVQWQDVGLVIERSRVRIPAGALPGSLQVNSAFHPSAVGKSSTSFLAGVKAGRVHLCRVAGNTV